MAPIHRILIKTHHMTSRKKILAITKAAKRLSCSVLLKTGGPPGVMIAEGESGPALEWLEVVRVSHPPSLNPAVLERTLSHDLLRTVAVAGIDKGWFD
jgi:hypothetical protein